MTPNLQFIQETTGISHLSCPLSSTESKADACIKEKCAAYVVNPSKCFYLVAAGYGIDLIGGAVKQDKNIYYMHDYQAVFKEHYDRVFRVAYRMLRSHEMAEDVAQEVFIRAYKNAKTVEPDAPLSAWLYRVTTNLCLDELRRRKACRIEPCDDLAIEEIYKKFKNCYQADPGMILDEKEHRLVIDKVLRNLSSHYCQALLLRCVDELSYVDIAYTMNTTIAGIRSIIFRARKQFIKLYTEYLPEEQ